jgi:oligosaccharide translocation protein RFT1
MVVLQAEKLVLAEGSKMVVAGLASITDQGVVGLVSNLGSLVARTLLHPLEEVAFAAFSR